MNSGAMFLIVSWQSGAVSNGSGANRHTNASSIVGGNVAPNCPVP